MHYDRWFYDVKCIEFVVVDIVFMRIVVVLDFELVVTSLTIIYNDVVMFIVLKLVVHYVFVHRYKHHTIDDILLTLAAFLQND